MASKVECDICKKVLDYKKTNFMEVYKRTQITKGRFEVSIDICDDCLEELKNRKEKQ